MEKKLKKGSGHFFYSAALSMEDLLHRQWMTCHTVNG